MSDACEYTWVDRCAVRIVDREGRSVTLDIQDLAELRDWLDGQVSVQALRNGAPRVLLYEAEWYAPGRVRAVGAEDAIA